MLTSRTRPARRPGPPALRRLPLGSVAVRLLTATIGGLGLLALALHLYLPALLLWSTAVVLVSVRQLAEQSRVANARFEEMARELRLIRQGLALQAGATGTREGASGPADPDAPRT
ncbi:hypothetical protein [Deinococcus planocerae]|uniref:hypothetical protein n=1 Tax=Deinococcus planocerae TaxID=1737569 RepID=UPI000C7E9757|nr:hypothetical protein [Deinococcus planocerae]